MRASSAPLFWWPVSLSALFRGRKKYKTFRELKLNESSPVSESFVSFPSYYGLRTPVRRVFSTCRFLISPQAGDRTPLVGRSAVSVMVKKKRKRRLVQINLRNARCSFFVVVFLSKACLKKKNSRFRFLSVPVYFCNVM